MEKKKLLFGLIEMNKTMFNILYTLLCVCVLIILLVYSAMAITYLTEKGDLNDSKLYYIFNGLLMYFICEKLFDAKHYA